MGSRRKLSGVLLAAFLTAGGDARAAEDPLAAARSALVEGQLDKAAKQYAAIGFADPAWAEKVEDLIRLHLIRGSAEEAWRIGELALRTKRAPREITYYLTLARTLARVCTLSETGFSPEWRHLLNAHVYRFASRFRSMGYAIDPYRGAERGRLLSHFVSHQSPFLADIPRTRLLRGRGCRFERDGLMNLKESASAELASLTAWYDLTRDKPSFLHGTDAVRTRLIELAGREDQKDLSRELLTPYAQKSEQTWSELPEPERRFLWGQLIEQELAQKPPYPGSSREGRLVQTIILASSTADAAAWAGLLDDTTLEPSARERLVDHLASIEAIPHRPTLELFQAEYAYGRGDMTKALTLVKKLLVDTPSLDDQAVKERATEIAMAVFSEYRYDQAMLGAIQTAVPQDVWSRIYEQVYLEHALLGQERGIRLLKTLSEKSAAARRSRWSAEEQTLIDHLAFRRLDAFQRELSRWGESRRLTARRLDALARIAKTVIGLNPDERARIKPYLVSLARYLQAFHERGQGELARIRELIHVFDQSGELAWARGSDAVRAGTAIVGVADLTQKTRVGWPFTWEAPDALTRRDLLVRPDGVATRGWVIE